MNVDEQRRAAGEAAAALVRDGMTLGYGTGRAAAAALEALARRKLQVRGVPTSERTADLCRALGLALTTLEETPELDLCIDGADEIDPRKQALKGGGGAMVREKLVAVAARRRLLVIEEPKLVPRLGTTRGLPIAALAFGWSNTLRRVAQLLPGAARRILEERRGAGEGLQIRVVGMLSIAEDVEPELARETIESVMVRGIFKASKEVKEALADRTC